MRAYQSQARHTDGAQSSWSANRARASSARSSLHAHEAEADRAAMQAGRARGHVGGLTNLSQGAAKGAPVRAPEGGHPLPPAERAAFESSFGRDFSQVRVHTDAQAAEAAEGASANAFTVGQHIVFGAGRYRPGTPQGRQLLAHELAHTAQQGSAAGATVGSDVGGVMQCQPKDEKKGIGSAPPTDTFVAAEGVGAEDTFVLFDHNHADLPTGADKKLLKMLEAYKTPVTVEINGYASAEGDAVYNSNLSAHRAAAVKALLLAALPPGSQVVLYARGETGAFGAATNNRRAGVRVVQGVTPAAGATRQADQPAKKDQSQGPPPTYTLDPSKLYIPGITLTPPLLNPDFGQQGPLAPLRPVVPPVNFNLSPLKLGPTLDWPALSEPFRLRGVRISDRDYEAVQQTVLNTYNLLRGIGFPHGLAEWGANVGTAKAYDTQLARDNPNAADQFEADIERHKKQYYGGEIKTPQVPIIKFEF